MLLMGFRGATGASGWEERQTGCTCTTNRNLCKVDILREKCGDSLYCFPGLFPLLISTAVSYSAVKSSETDENLSFS